MYIYSNRPCIGVNNHYNTANIECATVVHMQALKIAILAQLDSPTITEYLTPELQHRGHTVDVIDLSSVPHDDFSQQPEIQSLTAYDIVYYRSGLDPMEGSKRIVALEHLLADSSAQLVNLHFTEHTLAHSKTYESKLAQSNGLLTPRSVYALENYDTLKTTLGTPFIIKTDQGTHGTGVHLVESETEFSSIISLYPDTQLLFQEFIPHDFEYRVHVMDGKAACIWKKAPPENDFRSNEAQGGAMLAPDPQYIETLTKLAQTTFAIFGFEIFVADFMLDKNADQFYFTEINLNPGWGKTDEVASGIDVIGLTADYFEKLCS